MREHLVEGETQAGRMGALEQRRHWRIRRRPMQVEQGLRQARQPQRTGDLPRHPVAQTVRRRRQQGECLVHQAPPRDLLHAFGGRIDRCQRFTNGHRIRVLLLLHLRVHHLQGLGTFAHLAETAQRATWAHGLGLRGREVEKAQHQPAPGGIPDPHLQGPTPAKGDLRIADHALDQCLVAGAQLAQWAQAGAVLITTGQVEQQILNGFDPQPLQTFQHARPDPLESVDRNLIQCDLMRSLGGVRRHLGTDRLSWQPEPDDDRSTTHRDRDPWARHL